MISTIFFDFDGVLTLNPNGYTITPQNIHKFYPDVSEKHFIEQYLVFRDDLQRGKKTHADIWEDYCHLVGKKMDSSILKDVFLDTPLNDEMVMLAHAIHAVGYRVGMLTNNTLERLDVILHAHTLQDFFDPLVISAAVGSVKSEKGIFEKALELTEAQPEEILFIDNQEKNLIIPKELGMHTYLHDDAKNDMEALRAELQRLEIQVTHTVPEN